VIQIFEAIIQQECCDLSSLDRGEVWGGASIPVEAMYNIDFAFPIIFACTFLSRRCASPEGDSDPTEMNLLGEPSSSHVTSTEM